MYVHLLKYFNLINFQLFKHVTPCSTFTISNLSTSSINSLYEHPTFSTFTTLAAFATLTTLLTFLNFSNFSKFSFSTTFQLVQYSTLNISFIFDKLSYVSAVSCDSCEPTSIIFFYYLNLSIFFTLHNLMMLVSDSLSE